MLNNLRANSSFVMNKHVTGKYATFIDFEWFTTIRNLGLATLREKVKVTNILMIFPNKIFSIDLNYNPPNFKPFQFSHSLLNPELAQLTWFCKFFEPILNLRLTFLSAKRRCQGRLQWQTSSSATEETTTKNRRAQNTSHQRNCRKVSCAMNFKMPFVHRIAYVICQEYFTIAWQYSMFRHSLATAFEVRNESCVLVNHF